MGVTTSKSARKSPDNKLKHYVNWFEIPALNLDRAVGFYNHIYVKS